MVESAIMAIQAEVSLKATTLRRAEERAEQLGLSVEQYFEQIVSRDMPLTSAPYTSDPSSVFDLGSSTEVTDIAQDKDRLIAEAVSAEVESERIP